MNIDIKKILITLILMHAAAFFLTACGKKQNKGNVVACPANQVYDAFGSCVYPNGFQNPQFLNQGFIENARIPHNSVDNFGRLVTGRQYGVYSRCFDPGNNSCRSLQIRIIKVSDTKFDVKLRGVVLNPSIQAYPAWPGGYLADQTVNEFNSNEITIPMVAQTRTENGNTVVVLQGSQYNANNPFDHAQYEHTLNQLYIVTDGLLSKDRLSISLYSKTRKGIDRLLATGTLVKGRDYL